MNQIVNTGSSNITIKWPPEPELPEPECRIDDKCLCLNSDMTSTEGVALHIGACILGRTITDENFPRIQKALELFKKS